MSSSVPLVESSFNDSQEGRQQQPSPPSTANGRRASRSSSMSNNKVAAEGGYTALDPKQQAQQAATQQLAQDVEQGLSLRGEQALANVASRLQIVYQDLSYSIQIKDPKLGMVEKVIIKGVTGVIQPARMTAVMGASGAGKTTFLNVLAGFAQGKVTVGGKVSVNGDVVNAERMRQISGFVHQEDAILDTMTVLEALQMAAQLKLPPSLPHAVKMRRAVDVALELNLTKALHNVVGGEMTKGISGGEKRRLSLGMEMITNPSALFLDEPTSGLDTHTAFRVISILQKVAHKQGRNIVATIHQPSSDIFNLFDDLIVLADGQVMYHGAAANLVAYFGGLGYQCPEYCNPADYLFMDILNRGALLEAAHSDKAAAVGGQPVKYSAIPDGAAAVPGSGSKVTAMFLRKTPDTPPLLPQDVEAAQAKSVEEDRVRGLLEAWSKSAENKAMLATFSNGSLISGGIGEGAKQHFAGFGAQFTLLGLRANRNQMRNPLILKGKLAQTLVLAIIIGLIYLNVNDDLKGVQNREGSLFFIMVQGLIGSVTGIITLFGTEKAVFKREYESRMYGLPAYFWSRWLVELPSHIVLPVMSSCIVYWMIGYQPVASKFLWFLLANILLDNCGAALGMLVACYFNDVAVAMAVMPVFLMPLMIFSGFFINTSNIPVYLRWISYISPIRYGFYAVAENEFSGLALHCTPSQNCAANFSGQSVINLLGLTQTVGENLAILFALMCALLALSYLALWNAIRGLGK